MIRPLGPHPARINRSRSTPYGLACAAQVGHHRESLAGRIREWKDSLIARLGPDEDEDALLEPHVKEFDISGKTMKGWVMVGPEGVEEDENLAGWVEWATKFVEKLPAK